MAKIKLGKEDAVFADGYKIIKGAKQQLIATIADSFKSNGLEMSPGDAIKQAYLRNDVEMDGESYEAVILLRRRAVALEGKAQE